MARHQVNQPSYDFITGGEVSPGRQPPRENFKQSTVNRADVNNENLRSQLHSLQYELDLLKQERELATLQQQQETREIQNRADADFKRAQAAEAAKNAAIKKAEQANRELQEMQSTIANEKLALEKKVRGLQDDNRSLQEQLDELESELLSQQRQSRHALDELEQKNTTLQGSVAEIEQELEIKVSTLQDVQQRLTQREDLILEMENEILRLKAQTGDGDTLAVIKKELSEQVAYIKNLESSNREQLAELKQFRKTQKSIEVVTEEKHALEAKLRIMEDLRRELSESQLQRRILEDEKRSWTSYLENECKDGQEMTFETPEQMAKAFLNERLERLHLMDKVGRLQPELLVKDENIQTLALENARLQTALEELRSTRESSGSASGGAADVKARARLERQKALMAKEVEYLRAQMKAFEAEDTEFSTEQRNEQQLQRIHELEEMVGHYRSEVQSLHKQLSETEVQPHIQAPSPKKRAHDDDLQAEERLGEMRRKARSLQDDLEKLQTRNQVLEAELHASLLRIDSLKEYSRTRVLELRNNPTAQFEAIKMATLKTLRDENRALLEHLEGRPVGTKVVPVSTLENYRLQLDDAQAQIKQAEKKTMRLKQVWGSKSLEFREAVCSILGWRLDFMPNGRVKATSILYPSLISNGEEQENSIVFDGENGTMKVSGGPQSVFATEIKGLIEFWVEGRKEIPCFLAACTLEFYDRTTRAGKM